MSYWLIDHLLEWIFQIFFIQNLWLPPPAHIQTSRLPRRSNPLEVGDLHTAFSPHRHVLQTTHFCASSEFPCISSVLSWVLLSLRKSCFHPPHCSLPGHSSFQVPLRFFTHSFLCVKIHSQLPRLENVFIQPCFHPWHLSFLSSFSYSQSFQKEYSLEGFCFCFCPFPSYNQAFNPTVLLKLSQWHPQWPFLTSSFFQDFTYLFT